MEHTILSDNIMNKAAILKLLCTICKNLSTRMVFCKDCSAGYCDNCSKRLANCLSCNSEVLMTRNLEEKEEKSLMNLKIECRNKDSGCGKILPYELVASHQEECSRKNNIRNANDQNMDENICDSWNVSYPKCSHNIPMYNIESIKHDLQQMREDFRQQISQIEKKIDQIKNCCVCKVRGKCKLCASCNFKSCNFCNLYCLMCYESMCLNCQSRPKISCSTKKCKNIICANCTASDTEISNLFKTCHFCKELICVEEHSLKSCDLCLNKFCKVCLIKCDSCNGKFCLPCDGNKNKKNLTLLESIDDFVEYSEAVDGIESVGKLNGKIVGDTNSYCKDHRFQKSILIGCGGGSIANFDTIKMKIIEEFSVATEYCKVSNVVNINDKLVTGLADEYKIKIWNNRKFDALLFSEIETGFAHEIVHLKDELILMVTQIPHQCLLIDIFNNKILQKISFEDIVPNALCKINNVRTLVGFHNGLIKLWDLPKNKLFCEINAHSGKIVNSIIKLEKNEGFMSAGQDRTLKIWTLSEGGVKKSVDLVPDALIKANVTLANWSKIKELKDGRIVHCAGNRSISIWDLRTNTNMILKSHSNSVYDFMQISENIMVSCSEDKCIKSWDLRKNDTLLDTYSHKSILYRFEI